jgi:hypothetical protein
MMVDVEEEMLRITVMCKALQAWVDQRVQHGGGFSPEATTWLSAYFFTVARHAGVIAAINFL